MPADAAAPTAPPEEVERSLAQAAVRSGEDPSSVPAAETQESRASTCEPGWAPPVQCIAGDKRLQESDWSHCPTPQSFIRCGPHERKTLPCLDTSDVERLKDLWWRYRDDLSWPKYDKKPNFTGPDFDTFYSIANKVVDAMQAEYDQPMVLDQATISNTNHIGHAPHADNVQFDSVWWKGKRIRCQDEVLAAQEGAYVLWRSEKTSYRSYSCSVGLADPKGYEGGQIQFFDKWGDTEPRESYKCEVGTGIAFCGCQRNIHAVTGVKSGFRLVFLVWTRPPHVRVPESQLHVCYFRPGTGLGCWLTTADLLRYAAKRRKKGLTDGVWIPKEEDDTCPCKTCALERPKVSWSECCKTAGASTGNCGTAASTPTTSAGNSPRTGLTSESPEEAEAQSPMEQAEETAGLAEGNAAEAPHVAPGHFELHCPRTQGMTRCKHHGLVDLAGALSTADMAKLRRIWKAYHDDLASPWYEKKPEFSQPDFNTYRSIAEKVVVAMSKSLGEPLVLDQATISSTNHHGHPPHADNVQFDSVWWHGRQIKQRDELVAARSGGAVLWKEAKTSYRNYSASIALSHPSEYEGGDLEFYARWGQREPREKRRYEPGDGVAFCGCEHNIHAVTGVRWGFRLVLLIWTRPAGVGVPEDRRHVCYFRPGTGLSVWLTTADLLKYSGKEEDPRQEPQPAPPDDLDDEAGEGGASRRRWQGAEDEGDGKEFSWGQICN